MCRYTILLPSVVAAVSSELMPFVRFIARFFFLKRNCTLPLAFVFAKEQGRCRRRRRVSHGMGRGVRWRRRSGPLPTCPEMAVIKTCQPDWKGDEAFASRDETRPALVQSMALHARMSHGVQACRAAASASLPLIFECKKKAYICIENSFKLKHFMRLDVWFRMKFSLY